MCADYNICDQGYPKTQFALIDEIKIHTELLKRHCHKYNACFIAIFKININNHCIKYVKVLM